MGGGRSDIIPQTITPATVATPGQVYQGAGNPVLDNLWSWAKEIGPQSSWTLAKLSRDYYAPFLQGNYNPESLPGFAPAYDVLRGSLEGQYGQAKQNILAGTPRGGAMADALANLEYQRARETGLGASGISQNLIGNLWSGANNLASGTVPQMVTSALQSASGTAQSGINQNQQVALQAELANAAAAMQARQFNAQANMQAQQANAQPQGKTGLGALGSGIGSLMGIAAAPFTGGTSLIGSGTSALGGLTSGKGGGGGSNFNMGNTNFASGLAGLSY